MNAPVRKQRDATIDEILIAVRDLLRSRPTYNCDLPAGPARTIDYERGRLRIEYAAYARLVDGRRRSIAPMSLDVWFARRKVLAMRWDADRKRKIATFERGEWIYKLRN
jgi:hypothetical protein